MKRIKKNVANAKVMIAFLIHLQSVILKDVRNMRKHMKNRKTSGSAKYILKQLNG